MEYFVKGKSGTWNTLLRGRSGTWNTLLRGSSRTRNTLLREVVEHGTLC